MTNIFGEISPNDVAEMLYERKACKFEEFVRWKHETFLQPYAVQTPRILISKFHKFSWAGEKFARW